MSPVSLLATVQTLTPAQHCSSSLRRSVSPPAFFPPLLACLLLYPLAVNVCMPKHVILIIKMSAFKNCSLMLYYFLSQVHLRQTPSSSYPCGLGHCHASTELPHIFIVLNLCYINLYWHNFWKDSTACYMPSNVRNCNFLVVRHFVWFHCALHNEAAKGLFICLRTLCSCILGFPFPPRQSGTRGCV